MTDTPDRSDSPKIWIEYVTEREYIESRPSRCRENREKMIELGVAAIKSCFGALARD